jgi:hypothetical protein
VIYKRLMMITTHSTILKEEHHHQVIAEITCARALAGLVPCAGLTKRKGWVLFPFLPFRHHSPPLWGGAGGGERAIAHARVPHEFASASAASACVKGAKDRLPASPKCGLRHSAPGSLTGIWGKCPQGGGAEPTPPPAASGCGGELPRTIALGCRHAKMRRSRGAGSPWVSVVHPVRLSDNGLANYSRVVATPSKLADGLSTLLDLSGSPLLPRREALLCFENWASSPYPASY